MTRRIFSREFKQEAVELITKRGVSIVQASRDLGIHAIVFRRWVRAAEADGSSAFPGNGKLTPEQDELRALRREVTKLKAKRDILKRRPPTSPRTSCDVWLCCEAPRGLAGELDGALTFDLR